MATKYEAVFSETDLRKLGETQWALEITSGSKQQ